MRTDNDQWDIATSVGVTALGVAAGRAVETARPDGLVDNPYAQAFLDAVPTAGVPGAGTADEIWRDQATYVGVRSRFFDDFFTSAGAAGIRQVVLLAAGLDTRALRLSWPAWTTVYEVDQPAVLDFKNQVLDGRTTDGHNVQSVGAGSRVMVAVDLRHDWPAALRRAGFDPCAPTAWLAEGLLPYLPAAAEDDLFAHIQKLSGPGSHIAVEHVTGSVERITTHPSFHAMSDRIGVDVSDLFYDEPRTDPQTRLSERGWSVTTSTADALARDYGRPLPPSVGDVMGPTRLLHAALDR